MIFPIIQTDSVVQVADKFRISASKSYVLRGSPAITKVEIQPEDGAAFTNVYEANRPDRWFLDYQYDSAGEKTISLRVTVGEGEAEQEETVTQTIQVLTEAEDHLFSNDDDLKVLESDILNYLPDGKSSFKYAHREAQRTILEWLYINGYRKHGNQRIQKTDFIDIEEVRYWSRFLTMAIICHDLKKAENDIWDQRAKKAENMAAKFRATTCLRFDYNGDGQLGSNEGASIRNFEWRRT